MARVSVVMPARKPNPRYFDAAVRSILGQSFKDWELIVVEDRGDATAESLLRQYNDARIRHIINEPPTGLGSALNAGISSARSALIARIDADDIAVVDRLEQQVAMFDREPALVLAGTQSAIIDDNDRVIATRAYPTDPPEIARSLMRYNCFCHPSVMFRRAAIVESGGYNASGLNEDYDLWCRLASRGALMRNHPAELVRYRFHEHALKRRDVSNVIRSTIEIKRRYFGGSLDARARLRIAGERLLLMLPDAIVVQLFRRLTYSPRRADA
jgi:glycosyltransferase involved in cell wall biosynthesis